MTYHDALIHLPRDTIVALTSIGNVKDRADGGGDLRVDYRLVKAGSLSRWQIRKMLGRYLLNNLVIAVSQDEKSSGRHQRQADRAKRWNNKHIRIE